MEDAMEDASRLRAGLEAAVAIVMGAKRPREAYQGKQMGYGINEEKERIRVP